MMYKRFSQLITFVFAALMLSIVVTGVCNADMATPIKVEIYSTYTIDSSDGYPFSDLHHTFYAQDIVFGTSTGWSWYPLGSDTGFGAVISGVLSVPESKTYPFFLGSDDGSSLYINNTLIIDNGLEHGPQYVYASVPLTAGLHPFEIRFWENGVGESGVDLLTSGSVTYTAIPIPGAIWLLGAGLVGLAGVRRRISR